MRVSVVLPLGPDARSGWISRILDRLAEAGGLEVVCVDPSEDGEASLLSGRCDRVVRLKTRSRAERLQAGIEASSGEFIMLHHPRSLIEKEGLCRLRDDAESLLWGGFTHAFDWDHPLLRFTSWYSNRVRAGLKGIVYLDHCIFFRRDLLIRPIPAVEIFEDTELSRILGESGPPALLPFVSTTSAVRFKSNGVWRQAFLNANLKLDYLLGGSDLAMNARYERGLGLNSGLLTCGGNRWNKSGLVTHV
jgi:hypothetical protein